MGEGGVGFEDGVRMGWFHFGFTYFGGGRWRGFGIDEMLASRVLAGLKVRDHRAELRKGSLGFCGLLLLQEVCLV